MKVLVVGVFRDGTGYAEAAKQYALALDSVGIDVAIRTLKLNTYPGELTGRLAELEARSARRPDAVIQICLPHQMSYQAQAGRNIGLFFPDTQNFRSSLWPEQLNCLDEVWVPSAYALQSCINSSVETPAKVVPCPVDVTKFQQSYDYLEFLDGYEEDFKFYFVGEMVRRKNLSALLQAFHLEFDPDESIQLVVKTNRAELFARLAEETKHSLKLHDGVPSSYKRELLLAERLTNSGMMKLHRSCQCFVMPSYGEAICLPAIDALGMGRCPVVTACNVLPGYLTDEEAYLVDYRLEPVYGALDTFNDILTGDDIWASIDVLDLRRKMRLAYVDNGKKAKAGIRKVYEFSYDAVGTLMRQILEESGRLAGATSSPV